jgi:hypothetical protein
VKKEIVAYFKVVVKYPRTCVEELMTTTKKLGENSCSPSKDSNLIPPECDNIPNYYKNTEASRLGCEF